MPLVSVIVPNYNHECFLKQRIDSILNQTFQDFELILLDDASTDGSVKVLQSYRDNPKVSELCMNESNSGSPFKQWQKGVAMATGTYIWIAESDDFCEPTFLEVLLAKCTEKTGLAYAQSVDVDDTGVQISHRLHYTEDFQPNIWKDDFKLEGREFLKEYLAEKNVIPNASAVIFKKSLVHPEIFKEALLTMKMCGDWWFWMQISAQTQVVFVNEPLNSFRIHEGVSRQHRSLKKKKLRLTEEAVCRNYLKTNFKILNARKNKDLVAQWCALHDKWAPFKKDFYCLNLEKCNSICLLLNFIKVKLK